MRERELGFFVSHRTKTNIEELSQRLKTGGWNVIHYQEVKELSKISPKIQSLMVIGGDGTLRLVTSSLYKEKLDIPVITFPGGTCNSFYHALTDAGVSMGEEELFEEMDYSCFKPFRPGLLGDKLFIVDVGLGEYEPLIGVINEELRNNIDIGRFRPKLAGLISWLSWITKKYNGLPPLDLYSVSPFFGTHKMFPGQDLFDDLITHTRVEAENKPQAAAKSFWAFFALGNGHVSLSRWFLTSQRAEQFRTNYPTNVIRIGGDTIKIKEGLAEKTPIRRAEKPILISAFSSPPNKP
jgi:hypothetical protein